jgi:hypothetical protein
MVARPSEIKCRLCVRFGHVRPIAASSHCCLDRVEKRACRAVTGEWREDGAASILPCLNCTLLLQRRNVAQDRLARTPREGGHGAHVERPSLIPSHRYRQPHHRPIRGAETLSRHGAHEEARADDSDTAVVFVIFASAFSASAFFGDRDVASAALAAAAIFVIHGNTTVPPFQPAQAAAF